VFCLHLIYQLSCTFRGARTRHVRSLQRSRLNLENCLKKKVNESRFEFGLSPLHSYIRFFEYLLHVSYRLDLKSWRVSTPEGKQLLSTRKSQMQNDFRIRMGIIVDTPRSRGSGTPNDGHTARAFF